MIWLKNKETLHFDACLVKPPADEDNAIDPITCDDKEAVQHIETLAAEGLIRERQCWLYGHQIDLLREIQQSANSVNLSDFKDIFIQINRFVDGRAFSLARQLRAEFGFKNTLWAVGDVIPDQYAYLLSCGFDGVKIPDNHPDVDVWLNSFEDFELAYQQPEYLEKKYDAPADHNHIMHLRHHSA